MNMRWLLLLLLCGFNPMSAQNDTSPPNVEGAELRSRPPISTIAASDKECHLPNRLHIKGDSARPLSGTFDGYVNKLSANRGSAQGEFDATFTIKTSTDVEISNNGFSKPGKLDCEVQALGSGGGHEGHMDITFNTGYRAKLSNGKQLCGDATVHAFTGWSQNPTTWIFDERLGPAKPCE